MDSAHFGLRRWVDGSTLVSAGVGILDGANKRSLVGGSGLRPSLQSVFPPLVILCVGPSSPNLLSRPQLM